MNRSWILLAVCVFLLLANSWGRPPMDPDETRYLEVAREMMELKSPFILTFNYEHYTEKPPLFFWLISLFSLFTGNPGTVSGLISVQLPSLLTLCFMLKICETLGLKEERFLTASFLSVSILFFMMARTIRMDMLLTLFTISGFWAYLEHGRTRDWKWVLLFACSLLGGMLTKGPVILVWLYGVPLFHAVLSRSSRNLRILSNPFSLLAALLPLLMAGTALVLFHHQTYLYELLVVQTLGRLTGNGGHSGPLYYYLLFFPAAAFPSSFMALPALWSYSKSERNLFLISWIFLPLLFFSCLDGKIIIYLLPSLPAMSLLAAGSYHHQLFAYFLKTTSVIFAILGLVLCIISSHSPVHPGFLSWSIPLATGLVVLLVTGISRFLGTALLLLSIQLWLVYPISNTASKIMERNSLHALGETMVRMLPEGHTCAVYRQLRPSLLLKLQRPIVMLSTPGELKRHLSIHPHTPLIINQKRFNELDATIKKNLRIVFRESCINDEWLIVVSSP